MTRHGQRRTATLVPVFSVDADAPPRGTGGASHADDIAQRTKEIPCGLAGVDFDVRGPDPEQPAARVREPGHAASVRDSLERDDRARRLRLAIERDRARDDVGDEGAEVRHAILAAACDLLPAWRFRIFAAWLLGANRSQIAKELGVSRSTVRSALDGEGLERAGPGAIAVLARELGANETFKKAVTDMAKKEKKQEGDAERPLKWFQGIDNRPNMVVPLAMLLVLDALADAKRKVRVGDVMPHFPRSLITPCMTLLKAHGFAVSDGHTITIHKVPCAKEAA